MPDRKPLSELERKLMDKIWLCDEVTVRSVLEQLNKENPKQRAYTTVMTVMDRLIDKGFLKKRREGKTDVFEATVSREEYLDTAAHNEVDALLETYGDSALTHFARHMQQLDPQRREKLRRIAEGEDN